MVRKQVRWVFLLPIISTYNSVELVKVVLEASWSAQRRDFGGCWGHNWGIIDHTWERKLWTFQNGIEQISVVKLRFTYETSKDRRTSISPIKACSNYAQLGTHSHGSNPGRAAGLLFLRVFLPATLGTHSHKHINSLVPTNSASKPYSCICDTYFKIFQGSLDYT